MYGNLIFPSKPSLQVGPNYFPVWNELEHAEDQDQASDFVWKTPTIYVLNQDTIVKSLWSDQEANAMQAC